MAIGLMDFPILSPEQANPIGYGMNQGADIQKKLLESQQLRQQMPYVGPQAAANVGLTQAEIPYTQAQATQALAQAGFLGTESDKIKYQMSHNLLYGDQASFLQYLQDTSGPSGTPGTPKSYYNTLGSELGKSTGQRYDPDETLANVPTNNEIGQHSSQFSGLGGAIGGGGALSGQNLFRNLAMNNQGYLPQNMQSQGTQQQIQPGQQQPGQQNIPIVSGPGGPLSPNSMGLNPSDPSSNVFGRDFGSPMKNAAVAALHPSPTYLAQQQYLKDQYTKGTANLDSAQQQSAANADISTRIQQQLAQYSSAYDKAKYKGHVLGTRDVTGFHAMGLGDVSNDQNTDTAAANMQGMQAQLLGGTPTNYKTQLAGIMKVSRSLDPQAKNDQVLSLNSMLERGKEEQKMRLAATALYPQLNPYLLNSALDVAWNLYNEKLPAVNFAEKRPIKKNEGQYAKFISPEAMKSILQTGSYSPVEKPAEYTQADLEHTAKKYNMSVDEVKKRAGLQ